MNFTPFPIMTTERLVLRQITEGDMAEFFILKSDERLLKGYDAKPKTYEEAYKKLQNDTADILRNECIIWGIALKTDNKLIGSICFWNIDEEKRTAEIGYELMTEHQGKGIMQEAIRAVIGYGFVEMQLQLIEAFPNPANASSVKLLEKGGFVRGEVFHETEPSSGRLLDRVVYTLANPQ